MEGREYEGPSAHHGSMFDGVLVGAGGNPAPPGEPKATPWTPDPSPVGLDLAGLGSFGRPAPGHSKFSTAVNIWVDACVLD